MRKIFILLAFVSFSLQAFSQITRKDLDLPSFNRISLNSGYTLHLKQTNENKVSVEVLTEIYDISEFKVVNGTLQINVQKKDDKNQSVWTKIDNIKIRPTMDIYVSVRDISEIMVNGGGKVVCDNSIAAPAMHVECNGPGSLNLDLKGNELTASVSGSGEMNLKGYATSARFELCGPGNLHAFDLDLKEAKASLKGSGTAEIKVSDDLEANIYGNGQLKFKGSTKSVKKNIYGQGTMTRAY